MDQQRFDTWTKGMVGRTHDRRGVVRFLASGVLGLAALGAPAAAEAKRRKKRKPRRKRKKSPFNEFRCLDVGRPCRGNHALCCSGRCNGPRPKRGKPDRSRCVAHHVGGCTPALNLCLTGDLVQSTCAPNAACVTTTGKASFCASQDGVGPGNCQVCRTDADCEAGFGLGAACVLLKDGICTGDCVGENGSQGTACFAPGY